MTQRKREDKIHLFIGGGTLACGQVHPPAELVTNDEDVVKGPNGCCSCRRAANLPTRAIRAFERLHGFEVENDE